MRYRLFALVLVGIGALALTCELPERQWERGFFEPYLGREYELPDGLDVRRFVGYEDETPSSFLPLDLRVYNETSNRIDVVMPAGLVFSPNNKVEYQYMILLQEFRFGVDPEADTTVYLPTYCCNEDLDEPEEDMTYSIALQVWERELNELFDIVKDKQLEGDDPIDLAQEALFEITDRDGLTEETRQALEQLP